MGRLSFVFIFLVAFEIQSFHCAINRNVKDECGKSKGCIFKPDGCTPFTNCAYFMSYVTSGDYVTIELSTTLAEPRSSNQWVAAGFSTDQAMGDDSVVYCVFSNDNAVPRVGLAYNTARPSLDDVIIATDNNTVIPIEGGVIDNAYLCRLRRKLIPSTTDSRIKALNTPYNILLASGMANNPAKLSMHTANRVDAKFPYVSGQINVADTQSYSQANTGGGDQGCVSAQRVDNLMKAHGILMLFGWWLFVATAILFARYFKTSWPGKKIMGTLIWFNCHRALNIIGVMAIASGFICIFIALCGNWIGNPNYPEVNWPKHSITGMTASICAFVQPIIAAVRCHPGTSKRPIFNWVHRFIGLTGFCCACATIYFARYFDWMGLHYDKYGPAPLAMMIFYWASLVVVVVALELLITISERVQRKKITNEMHMQGLKGEPSTEGTGFISAPLWNTLRMVLLSIFVIIALAVVITLSCFIGINGNL